MRISKEQESKNRQAIIKVASALCCEKGYKATDIAALVRAAGFTYNSQGNPLIFKQNGEVATDLSLEDYMSWIASQLDEQDHSKSRDRRSSEQHFLSKVYVCSQEVESIPSNSPSGEGREADASFYSDRIEMHLALLMRYLPSAEILQDPKDNSVARQQALYVLSKLVGAMIVSSSVVKKNPLLAEEILNAGAGIENSNQAVP